MHRSYRPLYPIQTTLYHLKSDQYDVSNNKMSLTARIMLLNRGWTVGRCIVSANEENMGHPVRGCERLGAWSAGLLAPWLGSSIAILH